MFAEVVKVNSDMSMAKVLHPEGSTPSKPADNIASERPFGFVEWLRQRCRAYSPLQMEALFMASNNNTVTYFLNMTPADRDHIFATTCTDVCLQRVASDNKERLAAIAQGQSDRLNAAILAGALRVQKGLAKYINPLETMWVVTHASSISEIVRDLFPRGKTTAGVKMMCQDYQYLKVMVTACDGGKDLWLSQQASKNQPKNFEQDIAVLQYILSDRVLVAAVTVGEQKQNFSEKSRGGGSRVVNVNTLAHTSEDKAYGGIDLEEVALSAVKRSEETCELKTIARCAARRHEMSQMAKEKN